VCDECVDEELRDAFSQRRRDEDYLCLVSDLAESLRAIDNGPTIFNT
jgi:hypothetical protein